MTILKHQDLTAGEWLQALRRLTLPQGEPAWMLVESHLECRLEKFAADRLDEYCYRGRIFCASGEWKWRRLPGAVYRCVFLGDTDWSQLAHDDSARLNGLASGPRDILLWGEYHRDSQVWLEQKIARHFQYPVDGTPHDHDRVVINVEEWQDHQQVQFVRYRELKNHV